MNVKPPLKSKLPLDNKTKTSDQKRPVTQVLILGSGAIGLLWYSHFSFLKNRDVNCSLYQSPHRKALSEAIKFTALNQDKHIIPSQIRTVDSKHDIDIILVCVKSYQVNQAIIDIEPLIKANTLVIITHNGLGALNKQSTQMLQNHLVLDLLTTHGCLKIAPNEIIHTGSGVSHLGLKFGQINTSEQKKRLVNITQLLNAVLPETLWCDDIETKQWLKLAINCVINPLTAIYDIKNGEVSHEKFTETIKQLINEIVAIASFKGINLNKKQLFETVLLVAKQTSNNSSSMRCDIQQGRKTEIEYINGYIHRLGQELNIPTPKNTELYHKVVNL